MSLSLDALPLEGISGLWNRLATLPDPRKSRGIRHPQLIVLKIVIAGILTGCTNVKALGEWVLTFADSLRTRRRRRQDPSRERLPLHQGHPSHERLSRVFRPRPGPEERLGENERDHSV
ncbi:MAG: transposase family protein [Leptospirales bacterium]